jgi:hypothetical protein
MVVSKTRRNSREPLSWEHTAPPLKLQCERKTRDRHPLGGLVQVLGKLPIDEDAVTLGCNKDIAHGNVPVQDLGFHYRAGESCEKTISFV